MDTASMPSLLWAPVASISPHVPTTQFICLYQAWNRHKLHSKCSVETSSHVGGSSRAALENERASCQEARQETIPFPFASVLFGVHILASRLYSPT